MILPMRARAFHQKHLASRHYLPSALSAFGIGLGNRPFRLQLSCPRSADTAMQPKLPRYMFLDLPRDVIRSVARFRLRAHTLRIETVTWTHNTSPTCDLCNAHHVQDEQHVLFHCTHPHIVSLRRIYASLFSSAGLNNVFAFLALFLPACTESFL